MFRSLRIVSVSFQLLLPWLYDRLGAPTEVISWYGPHAKAASWKAAPDVNTMTGIRMQFECNIWIYLVRSLGLWGVNLFRLIG